MSIGGSDSMRYDGELSYVDVVEDAKHWEIPMDG